MTDEERAFKQGYDAGFESSGEGWNGELPKFNNEVAGKYTAERDLAWGLYLTRKAEHEQGNG